MLKTLRLQNYRKHAELTVNFGAGINAIRAENEAGKTTCLEAIAYALFGSAALAESLDDVVTYGLAVSKLRVELDFDFLGVAYSVYRAKSGAELTFGRERITGQKEVTRFIENLLGADAKIAGKLMIAEQTELRGALTDGPTAAGQLIEKLADFDLLDQIVDLVQERLSAGNTAAVEGRIAVLREQAVEPTGADLSALDQKVAEAHAALRQRTEEREAHSAAAALIDGAAADAVVAGEARLSAALARRSTEITNLKAKVAVELPVEPTADEIAEARAGADRLKKAQALAKLRAELIGAGIEPMWEGDLASLEQAVAQAKADLQKATATRDGALAENTAQAAARRQRTDELREQTGNNLNALELDLVRTSSKLIKEESCAFCGKDLKDIPEVAKINNPLYAKVTEIKAAIANMTAAAEQTMAKHWEESGVRLTISANALRAAEEALTVRKAELAELGVVLAKGHTAELLYARADDAVLLDRGFVPARWVWCGDEGGIVSDWPAVLAKLEAQQRAAVAATAARAEQLQQLDAARQQHEIDLAALAQLDVVKAKEDLAVLAQLKSRIAVAAGAVAGAEAALVSARHELALAKAEQDSALRRFEQAKVDLAAAEAELVTMQFNNALVKKVRGARPAITDQLWSIVLAGVSKHFSGIRKEASSITRGDGGFKVNGRPAAGLSGSAKDMLGLAIRISLVKTFLPGVPFLSLDEPGSACSDARETSMLGVLSTAGFEQVIIVTHSPIIDSFADHIINI